jgi:diguanylate cyclase (GGDEF)-like protein
MELLWKRIYPWIKATVSHLDSTDSLLRQAVQMIAATYTADCALWITPEQGLDEVQVYATVGALRSVEETIALEDESVSSVELVWQHPLPFAVERKRLLKLPAWLEAQCQAPRLVQLETGELIIPVVNTVEPDASTSGSLQFVLMLHRPEQRAAPENLPHAIALASDAATQVIEQAIRGWSAEELESVAIVATQLGLAYSALYWRQQLELSRQRSALVGRIVHLLNSSLNPDEIVRRIVAELGQGLQCDRSILVDLRDNFVNVLAIWEQPDQALPPLHHHQTELWQNVIDLFLQGGASHLQVVHTEAEFDPLQLWLNHLGATTALMVPLSVQEEFFGVVCLLSYRWQRIYELDELQTVRQVANQAAIALTNAQHYQTLWHKQEALRLQNNSLQLEIIRDELTQLMNRRSLERELEQLSTKAVWAIQAPFSIIVCDIDYFKLVNDTHGHLIGDEVLQQLAQRLQQQLRRETPAYRYGGEEFVVILAETSLKKAIDVAERLRQAIRITPMETNVGNLEITASFGVTQQNSLHDQHAWDVLQRADKALYEAKRQGRDRVTALPS